MTSVRPEIHLLLEEHIATDKQMAAAAVTVARDIANRSLALPVDPGLKDALRETQTFLGDTIEQKRAVRAYANDLHFAKADTVITSRGSDQDHLTYLITRHRVGGAFAEDDRDWIVVSWTSPITARLLDQAPNSTFIFSSSPRRPDRSITVKTTARFGQILPDLRETTYSLPQGDFYVASEETLSGAEDKPDSSGSPAPYMPDTEAGLTDIIVEADQLQRSTMHLPFADTLLVEGPPGSGKTSIGLMRIPCLIDRQWEELELTEGVTEPFHTPQSMRILVLNDEMVDYLRRLIVSVGVEQVGVSTATKLFQRLCREGKTLEGRRCEDSEDLAHLKSLPAAVDFYWAGFQQSLGSFTKHQGTAFRRGAESACTRLGPPLVDSLSRVIGQLLSASQPDGAPSLRLSLARALANWEDDLDDLRQDARHAGESVDVTQRKVARLRRCGRLVVRKLLSRRRILRYAFNTAARKSIEDLASESCLEEWREQGVRRRYSEADLALSTYLAAHCSSVLPSERITPIGCIHPRLSHIVIDEAQDATPAQIVAIKSLFKPHGSLTLVGDLRQRLASPGAVTSWDDLGIESAQRAVFSTNHRQSRALGELLKTIYTILFDEQPSWQASDRVGPAPRLIELNEDSTLSQAIAGEVAHWRSAIPNATVGILWPGGEWSDAEEICAELELLLGDSLTDVHLATEAGTAHYLGQVDCAIMSTAIGTKGLEFDAVVLIDPLREVSGSLCELEQRNRNELYVAISRARQGASILLEENAPLLNLIRDKGRNDLLARQ